MSGQALDLKKSATIVWRHRIVAGTIVALGLIGNTAYFAAQPQMYTASALVVLPPPPNATTAGGQTPSVNVSTQSVVVTSVPVLVAALRSAGLGVSLAALQHRITVAEAGALTISISAQGDTAQQAERTANAVTRSYIAYITAASNPAGQQPAELLQPAATASAKPRTTRVYEAAAAGAAAGAVVALIAVLAIWGNDRRLRKRDAIADSIGVPVLAGVRASSPADAAGWTKLFWHYEPPAGDAWLLQRALRELGLPWQSGHGGTGSVAVLSLTPDRAALALGPQLAVSAAAQGIPTALVVGPCQATREATARRAAGGAATGRDTGNLRVMVSSHEDVSQPPAQAALTVAVDVVSPQAPRLASTPRADVTLLAVTAGAVTAKQLVRVAAAAAGAGRTIAGILVANPEPGDQTTGRLPQLARLDQHQTPTRMVGLVTESRR